jgi:hypothetical protein
MIARSLVTLKQNFKIAASFSTLSGLHTTVVRAPRTSSGVIDSEAFQASTSYFFNQTANSEGVKYHLPDLKRRDTRRCDLNKPAGLEP